MRKIAKEYDEPFVDVVKGFAAMRCSKAETHRTLGISGNYFYYLLRRFDLAKYFYPRSEHRKGTYPPKAGIPNLKNRKHTDDELLREIIKYETSTEFKNKSKVSVSTVYRRFGGFRKARKLADSTLQ